MSQKTVLLGVTGCIAAYKAGEMVRGLQKAGVRVKVVMTEHACEFVGPTTFRALTREPVAVRLFDEPGDAIHHISLAQECDAFLVAPCTANVLAKLACGLADDLLTTTALATTAPLVVAPAMNVHMYENAATQANLGTLRSRGVRVVEAAEGYLACGEVGSGRLASVDDIVAATLEALGEAGAQGEGHGEGATDAGGTQGAQGIRRAQGAHDVARPAADAGTVGAAAAGRAQDTPRDLAGTSVLVTAGPTVEPLDSVRYLSNYSSGKMGYALARAAARRGAQVTLVSGPVALDAPEGVRVVPVHTACEMCAAAEDAFAKADVAIFSAAVADMRPARRATRKLKKGIDGSALSTVELVENPDVLATCAARKRAGQVVVGFAAETDDVVRNAQAKLVSKNADMMVANEVGAGRAFGTDDNEASLVTAGEVRPLPRMSKLALADEILSAALQLGVEGSAPAA